VKSCKWGAGGRRRGEKVRGIYFQNPKSIRIQEHSLNPKSSAVLRLGGKGLRKKRKKHFEKNGPQYEKMILRLSWANGFGDVGGGRDEKWAKTVEARRDKA